MTEQGRLIFGLPFNGQRHHNFTVKPLTIGNELKAQALLDDLGDDAAELIHETLAYWQYQLSVDGINQDVITVDYLLEHLTSDDYTIISDTLDLLRVKYVAAGAKQPEAGV